MKQLIILTAQKRRLLSKIMTLEATRDKAQNKINDLLQQIEDIKFTIEDIKK